MQSGGPFTVTTQTNATNAFSAGTQRPDRLRDPNLPVLWLAGYFFPPLNHDVAAILYVSDRWIGGDRLYVDIIDENLPLTFIVTQS